MAGITGFGQLWPDWYIDEQIGSGSFGVVYKAHREDGFSTVVQHAAVKHIGIPSGDPGEDTMGYTPDSLKKYYDDQVNTLIREIDTMVSLRNQPNIVSYEEHRIIPRKSGIGYDLFLRMELLTSLPNYIRSNSGCLNRDFVLRLGIGISRALRVMEDNHIIHRDVKPANVFVDEKGIFKLGDFGTARILSNQKTTSMRTGTIAYMAPEVYFGNQYDQTVDIYSLGLMLYGYLNQGVPPLWRPEMQNQDEHLMRRFKGVALPAPVDADADLAAVILKCCAYDPRQRYQNAAQLLKALEACRRGNEPTDPLTPPINPDAPTREPVQPYPTEQPTEKGKRGSLPAIVGAAAAVAVLVCAAVFGQMWFKKTIPDPTTPPAVTTSAVREPSITPNEKQNSTHDELAAGESPMAQEAESPLPAPPMINGLVLTERGVNYLKISWNVAYGDAKAEVYYRRQGETNWTFWETASSTSLLSQLEPGYAYDIRVVGADQTVLMLMNEQLYAASPKETAVISPSPTEEALETSAPAMVAGSGSMASEAEYCTIKLAGAKGRTGPGTEYSQVVAIPSGRRFLILESTVGSNGSVWYRIEVEEKECWISSRVTDLPR